MNFQIVKTRRIAQAKRPIHLQTTRALLRLLGKRAVYDRKIGSKVMVSMAKYHDPHFMWNLRDEAKHLWLSQIRAAGHDFTENHEACARLNAIWTTLKKRFAALGIE